MQVSSATNACDLLDADHLAVKHLFVEYARIAHAHPSEGEGRLALARRICDELTVHAQLEEEIFYPAFQKASPDDADLVARARAEHGGIEALIATLQGMQSADPAMDVAVAELARQVAHHVKEERDEMFPKARTAKALNLAALAERLRERREALAKA